MTIENTQAPLIVSSLDMDEGISLICKELPKFLDPKDFAIYILSKAILAMAELPEVAKALEANGMEVRRG